MDTTILSSLAAAAAYILSQQQLPIVQALHKTECFETDAAVHVVTFCASPMYNA